jgi:hypothetical protein
MYDWLGGDPTDWPDKPGERVDKTIHKPWRIKSFDDDGSYLNYGDHAFGVTSPQSIGNAVYISSSELVTNALQKLNPVRPLVSIPNFVFELRELPSLIRDTGRLLLGRSGTPTSDAILAHNFGWAPLLNDLRTMFSFTEQVQKRVEEIEKIRRTKRIEGQLGSLRTSWNGTKATTGLTPVGYIDWRLQHTANTRAWFVATLATYNPPPTGSPDEMFRFKRALSSGSTMSVLWNALPWSWMIDYFVSVSDYLEANQGYTYYSCSSLNICQSCTVTTTVEVIKIRSVDSSTVSMGKADNKAWKRTTTNNAVPRISFTPFLTPRMMLNLLALGSSRSRYSRT